MADGVVELNDLPRQLGTYAENGPEPESVAARMAKRASQARRLVVIGDLAALSVCVAIYVQSFLRVPDPGRGWLAGLFAVVPGICIGVPALAGAGWLGFSAWAWTLGEPQTERVGFVATGISAALLLGGVTLLVAVP